MNRIPCQTLSGSERGVSLIELLVGITLLGVLLLGFLPIFPMGTRAVEKGNLISTATDLAQDRMEWVKALSWDDPSLAPGVHQDPDNPVNGLYQVSWTVIDDDPVVGMRRVDVTVAFTDRSGPRTIVLSTYLKS